MTFLASVCVVVIATAVCAWVNDKTKIGGDYLSEEEMNGKV